MSKFAQWDKDFIAVPFIPFSTISACNLFTLICLWTKCSLLVNIIASRQVFGTWEKNEAPNPHNYRKSVLIPHRQHYWWELNQGHTCKDEAKPWCHCVVISGALTLISPIFNLNTTITLGTSVPDYNPIFLINLTILTNLLHVSLINRLNIVWWLHCSPFLCRWCLEFICNTCFIDFYKRYGFLIQFNCTWNISIVFICEIWYKE